MIELLKRLLGCKEDMYRTLSEEQSKLIFDKEKEIEQLKIIINKQETENEVESYWNNKRPKADIYYKGRVFPTTKDRLEIDVKLFITPQDAKIHELIRTNSLYYDKTKSINEHILNIYKWHQKKFFKYAYDEITFGIPELWVFPHELIALREIGKGLDCDDFGNSLASFLIASGVDYWRIRCVAGTTWSGEGHLTVYVLSEDNQSWYHINSTTSSSFITATKLEDLPKSNDSNDKIGIKDVWFSYNNKYSWHEFETKASAKNFDKKGNDLFRIVV